MRRLEKRARVGAQILAGVATAGKRLGTVCPLGFDLPSPHHATITAFEASNVARGGLQKFGFRSR